MRSTLIGLVLLGSPAAAADKDLVYKGSWDTTNRKLTGTMTCVVTDLGDNKWRGHFSGAWQGVKFSYKVDFSGPPEKLRGKARIDGADYEWAGEMSKGAPGRFKGKFWGNRYRGHFSLKQQVK
jgi:hypothetical protein